MSAKSAMSPDLIAFLKAWYHWATNGAPHREPFSRHFGLCGNTLKFDLPGPRWRLWDELSALFDGVENPFGERDFTERDRQGTQHECPPRLAWVRERLIEAGELRNCDDCGFSTTEQDVTVCPDRACRGSVA